MRTAEEIGAANLAAMFALADGDDLAEARLSYGRYHQVMRDLAELYGFPVERAAAAFCALSPNNDYVGNLRSVVSLLYGVRHGWPLDEIQCSTYRHCLARAHDYVTGAAGFLAETEGRKIRSFYRNILNPDDPRYVTVDGHVCAAWRGERLTMKEALVKGDREYDRIEGAVMALACRAGMLPNQYQAAIWFTRKRVFNIRAEMHRDLFIDGDVWRTYRDVRVIRPFGRRRPGQAPAPAEALPDLFAGALPVVSSVSPG
jgi:hypothetical protein